MSRLTRRVVLPVALAVVSAGIALGVVLSGGGQKTVTAFFSRVTGLYVGSDVRILGVKVGSIQQITPEGTRVKVVMAYNDTYRLPANVGAVIVPPSIVSDRYIQLTPVYTGGPVLASGGTIPEARTAVPLELDQIYQELNQLDVALGPQGANKHGALSRLIAVSARNLAGNGQAFNNFLRDFSAAITTLGENRGNFFGTLTNLQHFTTTLAQDNQGVLALSHDLAGVSGYLDGERQDLAVAMHNLSIALGLVAQFVHTNRSGLTADIHSVTAVTSGILTEKRALIEFLDDAPVALQNLALAYDPKAEALRTRSGNENASQPCAPTGLLYQLLTALGLNCPASAGGVPNQPALTPPRSNVTATQSLASLLGVLP
jgi:phospholipid/cholesterol/gamma-HCH transport system substrate-binding protein